MSPRKGAMPPKGDAREPVPPIFEATVHSERAGTLTVDVLDVTTEDGNAYRLAPRRSHVGADGMPANTWRFRPQDVPQLIRCFEDAYTWVLERDPAQTARPMPKVRLVSTELVDTVAELGPAVRFPQDVVDFVKALIVSKDREHFVVLHLDGAHHVVSYEVVAVGTANSCSVHAREVFKAAILANAVAIICAHNHPSGSATPSHQDRAIHERLKKGGELLGIELLDSLVVSRTGYHAFSEEPELFDERGYSAPSDVARAA